VHLAETLPVILDGNFVDEALAGKAIDTTCDLCMNPKPAAGGNYFRAVSN